MSTIKELTQNTLLFDFFNGLMVEMLNEQELWRHTENVRLQVISEETSWHVKAELFVPQNEINEATYITVGSTPSFEFTDETTNNPFVSERVELAVSDLIAVVIFVLKRQQKFRSSYQSGN